MASVRLGYCYYFLPLLLFFYTFQHPSPDSTTNSDRPIYRLNGQPKIGILLLFFTLAISFSINEYYLLYDTPLLENNTVLVYVRNNVTYLLTYSNLHCIGDSNHIGEYEFQFQFQYGVHITSVACTTTDAVVQVPEYKASKHETHTTTALVSIEQMSLILYKMSLTYTLDYLLED